MDAFARGLRNAARMQQEGMVSAALANRYQSYNSGIGAKIEEGSTSLEELEVGASRRRFTANCSSGRSDTLLPLFRST